jgi:hypothetical protein
MMRKNANELQEIAKDITIELARLEKLQSQIAFVEKEIKKNPDLSTIFYESLALKLHNFYTGCERIFQIIATELNGGLPSGYDWHRRLLERMASAQAERPAVITEVTKKKLEEFLAFRHVVRNIYGFEIDPKRLENLVTNYDQTWSMVHQDIQQFTGWLTNMTKQLEADLS